MMNEAEKRRLFAVEDSESDDNMSRRDKSNAQSHQLLRHEIIDTNAVEAGSCKEGSLIMLGGMMYPCLVISIAPEEERENALGGYHISDNVVITGKDIFTDKTYVEVFDPR